MSKTRLYYGVFCEFLKGLMIDAGITNQNELALLSGVSEPIISKLFNCYDIEADVPTLRGLATGFALKLATSIDLVIPERENLLRAFMYAQVEDKIAVNPGTGGKWIPTPQQIDNWRRKASGLKPRRIKHGDGSGRRKESEDQ